MREVLAVLTSISAPFYISEGSLLYLYKDCGLGDADLDLVVDLSWWNSTNGESLNQALISAGFQRIKVSGKLEELGYEESYLKNDIKVKLSGYNSN